MMRRNDPPPAEPDPASGGEATQPAIAAVQDLVQFARAMDLPLADEFLTDILGRLHGWPVDELDRLR